MDVYRRNKSTTMIEVVMNFRHFAAAIFSRSRLLSGTDGEFGDSPADPSSSFAAALGTSSMHSAVDCIIRTGLGTLYARNAYF